MSRESSDELAPDGTILNGYDYDKQAWVINGRYSPCAHPDAMKCDCYGKAHQGEKAS